MGEKNLTWKTETEKESVWERIICLCLCKQPQFHHIIIICALFIFIFISLSPLSCIVIIVVPAKYFHHTSFLHRYRFQFIYLFTREASQSLNAFVWDFFVAYIVAFHSEFLRILNEKRQHFLLVFNKFPLSICLPQVQRKSLSVSVWSHRLPNKFLCLVQLSLWATLKASNYMMNK